MKWNRIKAIIVRDLKLIVREKSTIFWLFIFPLILLSGYVALFTPRGTTNGSSAVAINIAVVAENNSSSMIRGVNEIVYYMEKPWSLNGTMNFKVNATIMYGLNSTLKKLRRGDFDAVVFVPENFYSSEGINVSIYVLRGTPNHVKEQLVMSYLYSYFVENSHYIAMGIMSDSMNKTALKYPELRPSIVHIVEKAWSIASKPNIKIVNVTPGEEKADIRSRVIGWMALSVIFMNFMFGGILGGSNTITSEIKRGFLQRLLSTRLKPSEYFSGLTISWIIILTVTTFPIYILGFPVFGGTLAVRPFSIETLYIVILILLTELLTFSLGIIIGMLAKSPEGASLIANLIIWATMIGGGFWIPKFMLPDFLKAFADVNIISVLFYAVTEIAVYGRPITGYAIPTLAAGAVSLLLYGMASLLYLKYSPRLVESAETR